MVSLIVDKSVHNIQKNTKQLILQSYNEKTMGCHLSSGHDFGSSSMAGEVVIRQRGHPCGTGTVEAGGWDGGGSATGGLARLLTAWGGNGSKMI